MMESMPQIYETEIYYSNEMSFKSIIFPGRSLRKIPNQNELKLILDIEFEYSSEFEYSYLSGLLRPGDVSRDSIKNTIYHLLSAQANNENRFYGLLDHQKMRLSGKIEEFSNYLIESSIIPFENSPLTAESLEHLIQKASGVGLGAYIGFLVGGTSPLLFITVPAGMIICGASFAVAKALEEGLKEKILEQFKKESKEDRDQRW